MFREKLISQTDWRKERREWENECEPSVQTGVGCGRSGSRATSVLSGRRPRGALRTRARRKRDFPTREEKPPRNLSASSFSDCRRPRAQTSSGFPWHRVRAGIPTSERQRHAAPRSPARLGAGPGPGPGPRPRVGWSPSGPEAPGRLRPPGPAGHVRAAAPRPSSAGPRRKVQRRAARPRREGGREGRGRRGGEGGPGRARREAPAPATSARGPGRRNKDPRPGRLPSERGRRAREPRPRGCITWSQRVKRSCQPQVHGLVP